MAKAYQVRAVSCDYRSSDEQVYQALKRATDPLAGAWERLGRARRIGIKFNQHWAQDRVVMHAGHRQQLVSDPLARAVLRLLQEHTTAEIYAIETGVEQPSPGFPPETSHNLRPVLAEFEVPLVDGCAEPVEWVNVPGGGLMFQRYPVPRAAAEADEIVSVQKLKNHRFSGVSLCQKNLFGLVPFLPPGRPRHYYHHILRLPYVLADLGRIFNPALNILDALVCQAKEEWGPGDEPRICNTLIAGDQVVATDACGMQLMGHDPQADWPAEPFNRDRNTTLVAAEAGSGTVNLDEIDFECEVKAPLGHFFSWPLDSKELVASWRRTTAEQGLYYAEHCQEFYERYAGQYILLQMGQVKWTGIDGVLTASRRLLSGDHPEQGMWMKYVDPAEMEGEVYQVYEENLRAL